MRFVQAAVMLVMGLCIGLMPYVIAGMAIWSAFADENPSLLALLLAVAGLAFAVFYTSRGVAMACERWPTFKRAAIVVLRVGQTLAACLFIALLVHSCDGAGDGPCRPTRYTDC